MFRRKTLAARKQDMDLNLHHPFTGSLETRQQAQNRSWVSLKAGGVVQWYLSGGHLLQSFRHHPMDREDSSNGPVHRRPSRSLHKAPQRGHCGANHFAEQVSFSLDLGRHRQLGGGMRVTIWVERRRHYGFSVASTPTAGSHADQSNGLNATV